jgi:hypothetical protein
MSAPPFFTFPVCGKRDAIRARHKARQVAALLRFSAREQACVAAGSFAIACQSLGRFRRGELCFQIKEGQLHVYPRPADGDSGPPPGRSVSEVSPLPGADTGALFRLVKPLPEEQPVAETDLGWLLRNALPTPGRLFDEVIRQNQEVLALLTELNACRASLARDAAGPASSSAA